MAKPKNVLRGTAAMYTVTQAPFYFTERAARAEYARLRAIAEKRLARLQAAGYSMRGQPKEFKPLQRDANERDVYKSLADVSRFLSMKSSTISGRKAQMRALAASLQDNGYEFINENNVEQFGEFMKEAKLHESYRGYDSEEVVELFHIAKEKHVKPEDLAKDLDLWMGNEKLLNMRRSRSTIDSEQLKERLELSELQAKRIRDKNKRERLQNKRK